MSDNLDFNRLDDLVRVADPRMDNLNNDEKWWESSTDINKIEFLRNGVNAKLEVIYDEKRYIFRPLSIQEEHECDWLAADDYNAVPEHRRNPVYKVYRFKLHQLSKALSATPASDTGLTVKQLENLPSPVLLGIYERYFYLMQELNADIDRMTQDQLNKMIKEIENEPSLVGKFSPQHSQKIILELLAANMLLRGKSPSESQ